MPILHKASRDFIAACLILSLPVLFGSQARSIAAEADAVASPVFRPATIVVRPEAAVLLGVARAGARLVAVGERGLLAVSDDNGLHWRQVVVPTSVTLTSVAFASPRIGWAAGHSGVVLKTTDGGETWRAQLDGMRALAIARAGAAHATGPWVAALRTLLRQLGTDSPFLTMHFSDDRHGSIAGANGFFFSTIDGGTTWTSEMPRFENPDGLHFYSLCASGNDLYLAGEQGRFYRSSDGGATFERLHVPYGGTLFAVASARPHEFLVGGLRGNAFFSTDGGAHFQHVASPVAVAISSISVGSDGTYDVTNQAGSLLRFRRGEQALHLLATPPLQPLSDTVQAADGSLTVVGFGGAVRLSDAGPSRAVPAR